jgi:2-C-methyl-D-erythritol 4-phosphate cytidylyltransferase
MKTLAVLIACGKEEEIKPGVETAFLCMGNQPVIAHSLQRFQSSTVVDGIVLVVNKDRVDSAMQVAKRFGCSKLRGVVVGGSSRLSSLRSVFSKVEVPATIMVHEASRPFVTEAVIHDSIKAAKRYGCAIAAHRLQDSIKLAPSGLKVSKTLVRGTSWEAQSPQTFRSEVLEKLLQPKHQRGAKLIDDESELIRGPGEVHLIEASRSNMKIRSVEDLSLATAIYNASH